MFDIEALLLLIRGLAKRVENKLRKEIRDEAEDRRAADVELKGQLNALAGRIDSLSYIPVFAKPDPAEGWMVNWLFNDGWYLGGIKKDCGGHPPVINDNHTSWAVLVINGQAVSEGYNHRLQIAWDIPNSKCYMRRGWQSENTWAGEWDEVNHKSQITDLGIVQHEAGTDYPNWNTDIGTYKIQRWADGAGNLPDGIEGGVDGNWLMIVASGAPDATTSTARTQYLIDLDTMAMWERHHSSYSGSGSFGDATEWAVISSGINQTSKIAVDATLSKSGEAADAKAVGDALDAIKEVEVELSGKTQKLEDALKDKVDGDQLASSLEKITTEYDSALTGMSNTVNGMSSTVGSISNTVGSLSNAVSNKANISDVPKLDATLKNGGEAADAKAVGDALEGVEKELTACRNLFDSEGERLSSRCFECSGTDGSSFLNIIENNDLLIGDYILFVDGLWGDSIYQTNPAYRPGTIFMCVKTARIGDIKWGDRDSYSQYLKVVTTSDIGETSDSANYPAVIRTSNNVLNVTVDEFVAIAEINIFEGGYNLGAGFSIAIPYDSDFSVLNNHKFVINNYASENLSISMTDMSADNPIAEAGKRTLMWIHDGRISVANTGSLF